jgi:hypothetical protein
VFLEPGDNSSPLVCSIGYASLDDASRVNYEALSYCWGDLSKTLPITLRHPTKPLSEDDHIHYAEQTFAVTIELQSALVHFRRKEERRTLWIDAICINQADSDERSRQVSMMGEIFSHGERVLVWLGPHDEYSELVWALLNACQPWDAADPMLDQLIDLSGGGRREWLSILPERRARPYDHDAKPSVHLPSDLETKYGIPATFFAACANDAHVRRMLVSVYQKKYPRTWSYSDTIVDLPENPEKITNAVDIALHGFFARPWFSRVWVIQEVFRAPKHLNGQPNVIVHIGHSTLPWQDLCESMKVLAHNHAKMLAATNRMPYYTDPTHGLAFFHESWLSMWQHGIMNRDHPHKIQKIVQWTRVFQASDFRDKLYAILELGSDTCGTNMRNVLLRPDYTRLADLVLFDFVRWHMEGSRNLDMLNFFPASRPSRRLRLTWGLVPRIYTWAPDLLSPRDDWPFLLFLDKGLPGYLERQDRFCRAIDRNLLDRSFTFEGSSLLIAGVAIGRIAKVIDYRHASGGTFSIGTQFHEVFTFIRHDMKHAQKEPHGAVFLQKAVRMFGVLESEEDMHVGFIRYLMLKDMVREGADATWDAFCKRNNYAPDRKDLALLHTKFEYRINSFHKNRRLFFTDDGNPALGPEHMQDDDVVVALYTGKTPYVMRPWGDAYRMLGPCLLYDQKAMDDVRYAPTNERSLELFEIL